MMRPMHLLVAAMLVGLGACSALRPGPPMEEDASYRLDRGLNALEAGQYRDAFDDLAWVQAQCAGHVRGAEALLAMAALELDPRNESGRPELGTDLLGQVLREPPRTRAIRPLSETTYLLALSLGAPSASDVAPAAAAAPGADGEAAAPAARGARAAEVLGPTAAESARGCGGRVSVEGWAASRLPELPGLSLRARLNEAERSRSAAAARADSVAGELARVTQLLEETRAELERIRKTLQP